MAAAHWRQELFCKSTQRARELIPFLLEQHRICGLNMPNKARGELPGLLERARLLSSALPHADICCHFSISHNYSGSAAAGFAALTNFCRQLAGIQGCSLLLVSGGGRRKQLDSLRALELAAASPDWQELRLPVAVAFNPYFPDAGRQQEERRRLRRKLMAGRGRVAAVYLQAGSDVHRLRKGLHHLRQLLAELEQLNAASQEPGTEAGAPPQQPASRPAKRQRQQQAGSSTAAQSAPLSNHQGPSTGTKIARTQEQRIQVFGSVLVPSRKLLANMKFRPWGGVFLSPQYLSGVQQAEAITRQVLQVYAEYSVTPLVETEVTSEAQAAHVQELL